MAQKIAVPRESARPASKFVGPGFLDLWWRLAKSPISLGVILLLVINELLIVGQPFAKVEPQLLPATHTWTWWATQEYLGTSPAPPVVLLGSSLLMHPVSRQDADFLGHEFDYVRHHYSSYMEAQLRKRFPESKDLTCFNFALPGDLVSDDYMVVRSLFHGKQKPRYLILGVSLRDFIDNAVNCPGTTPPFRYLKRFTNIDDIVDLAMPGYWQRLDYHVGKFFYLWDKKLDLQVLLDQATRDTVAPALKQITLPSPLNNLDYRKHVPSDLHSEVEEGMAIIKPHLPYEYDANFADYRRRCGSANDKMFAIQGAFFKKLADLCKQEGIQLIVLNMPLTKENVAIMPKGSYERYLSLLERTTEQEGFRFVDLNANGAFVHSDFYDTAHMTSSGGKKLIDILANLDCLRF